MNVVPTGTIDGATEWVALLGYPVKHSFSPAMHNAAFSHLAMNWRYGAFAVPPEKLGEAIRGLAALGFRGANVTVPHKEAVMEHLDAIDPVAQRLGAVNTIVFTEEGKRIGYNTDGIGFMRGLAEEGVTVTGKSAVVLGAGGAARAVIFALVDAGLRRLTVVNRSTEKAEALLNVVEASIGNISGGGVPSQSIDFNVCPWEAEELQRHLKEADLLINATSLGMVKGGRIEPYSITIEKWLTGSPFIADLVYNPVDTILLKAGRERGLQGQNGLPMLLYQGVRAFELWTGREAPAEVMQQVLKAKMT
ncbi:shikimate dehydrogenase [Heliobacterium chlorum]|uniref:Shikimate dehydrogenase (NADP(+)) n=1 Tax=Heliobacterium chlorum TaxID=2698 RepID=A0ABR7T2D8_HELCL|nr:shikimate dehydrogenase [Heliobacterium chlorum]MBC9784933.1 shikimate dehydrogenase [Heliobacterium chlorum]